MPILEGNSKQQLIQFQNKFEKINIDRLQDIIRFCEEYWDIIREPTVCEQLTKCQKILSNRKIQQNLKEALILQLITFSVTGFLFSCGLY